MIHLPTATRYSMWGWDWIEVTPASNLPEIACKEKKKKHG